MTKSYIFFVQEQKIALLTNELAKSRRAGQFNEQFIVSFKRELGNLVNSSIVGKDLEECVKVQLCSEWCRVWKMS